MAEITATICPYCGQPVYACVCRFYETERKFTEAERTIEKQKDHIALLLAAYRGKVDKDDELLAEIGEDYAEHGATIEGLREQIRELDKVNIGGAEELSASLTREMDLEAENAALKNNKEYYRTEMEQLQKYIETRLGRLSELEAENAALKKRLGEAREAFDQIQALLALDPHTVLALHFRRLDTALNGGDSFLSGNPHHLGTDTALNGKGKIMSFKKELENLINYHSKENGSNTPDFILADYMAACLDIFDQTTAARDKWFGILGVTGNGKEGEDGSN